MARIAIAGIFIIAIACGVGFGVASADSVDELADAGAFGFDEETHIASLATASGEGSVSSETGTSGQLALESASQRDISAGLAMLDGREAAEQARDQAETAAAANRVQEKKAQQGVEAKPVAASAVAASSAASTVVATATATAAKSDEPAQAGSSSAAKSKKEKTEEELVVEELLKAEDLDEYNLPAVDWSVGKKAFLETWTKRIDRYLDGTPLEGYGSVFAEGAWENGIDPRWSPAISNTESGNGTHCFLPHNAWGWGDDSWPDWETAIRAHIDGLAAGYGYSLTFEAAQKYCPPNCVHWFNNTLGQMRLI